MPPIKRGPRRPRAAGRRVTKTGDAIPTESEPMATAGPDLTPVRPAYADEAPGDIEMENGAFMSTPQARLPLNALIGTADFSQPLSRSTRKGYFDTILVDSPSTQVQNRLRVATIRDVASVTTTSRLEEARDIQYERTEEDGERDHEQGPEADEEENIPPELQDDELEKGHPNIGGLRVARRSDRIRAKVRAPREPSPSTALSAASSNNNRVQKRRKKHPSKTNLVTGPLRRSPRLAKPLDTFHEYPRLPAEIKLMIWEAAVLPRLTYICNRSSILSHAHNFGIQNKLPSWFMACRMSAYVATRCYKKLFAHNGMVIHPGMGIPTRHQDINPFVDIVIFEPCHSGCRGYYCAQQYSQEDRAVVQKLAVQVDSPHLPTTSEPGWVTVSRSWPNVTTLFMMKPAVRGLDHSDKAMIRIKEGDHEVALRKLFDAWKKGTGKTHKLTTIEFVRVVEQEPETKNTKDRYQSVEDRNTGLVEDIIFG